MANAWKRRASWHFLAAIVASIGLPWSAMAQNAPPTAPDPNPGPLVEGETEGGTSWALLPIIGFSPDTSLNLGLKFRESDFLREDMVIDLQGSYALLQQQKYLVTIDDEHLLGSIFSFRAEGGFYMDPALEFFGIGAGSPGPEESSNHLQQRYGGTALAGFWPTHQIHISFGASWEEVTIGVGRDEDSPSTPDAFPDLVGIDGGPVRSLVGEIEFDQYPTDFLRMRGAKFRARIEEVGPTLDNEFDFTRYEAEVSYVQPLFTKKVALGLRIRGELVEGSNKDIPFFELPTLGGTTTLRGFYPERFRGRGSLLGNLELRAQLFTFNFFDIWDVTLGGTAFADSGRVFASADELRDEWDQDYELSYGGGVRFILGRAIMARVDVGFSDEETGQVFLGFGQMF